MNLHTKITATIALYLAAVALVVPLAALSANTHPTDTTAQAASVTAIHPVSTAHDTPTDCTQQNQCPDDATDYWAKDAFTAYIAPLDSGITLRDAEDGFNATYVGTYSSAPNWGPNYVSVPSTTAPNVYHVFLTSPAK